jgi:hypothetical protein
MDTDKVPAAGEDLLMTEDEIQDMKISNAEIKVLLGQLVNDVAWLKRQFVGNGKPGLLETIACLTEQMSGTDKKYVSYGKALAFIGLAITAVGALGWFGYNHFSTQVYASTTSYCISAIKTHEEDSRKVMEQMEPVLVEKVRKALKREP